MYNGRRDEDLQTSRHVQRAPRDAAIVNITRDDLDDSDSDTELFKHANKPSELVPPVPAANLNRNGHHNRDQHCSSEEISHSLVPARVPRRNAGHKLQKLRHMSRLKVHGLCLC